MWDFVSYRLKQEPKKAKTGPSDQSRREKDRAKLLSLKKVAAKLRFLGTGLKSKAVEQKQDISVQVVLNDFHESQARFFSKVKLVEGQSVALMLASPRVFYVKGKVIWSYEANPNSHILTGGDSRWYRSAIEFDLEGEAERGAILEFMGQIETVLGSGQAA